MTLNAAEEQKISAESHGKETIEGLGVKLNKDNIRLGGFVSEDVTTSSKSTETTHKAGSIQTENLKIQGADGVDVLGQNIKATGNTVIDHGRGALNIGGYENKTEAEEKSHTETISTEVGIRNAYLDAALAVVAVKDAAKALSDAKDAYRLTQRDHAAGKITKEALDDSKANVAMATANLANAQIAVGAAAASAAASTATYGFTIGANGERIETTTTTNTLQGEWQGSNLDLNNLMLKSEHQDVNIQGSRVSATGITSFDGTKDLNVTAGTEHAAQDSSSKTNSQSVSYTYGGGGSASVGKQTSKSQSESLTHVNSQVELNQTAGSINKLNIQGGEVSIADRGSLKVNEIHVESLQDTATSSNSSKGGSIGAGFGSSGLSNVTAGYNQNKGNSDSAWVNDTSKLLIGNAQNNADLDAMGVKNVSNIGGVIANATKNSDGTLTDHGKLNYSSELELKDIQDHNYSSGSGFNVSTSIGIPQKGTKEASTHPKGSTTIGLNSSGQETEQLTKATMGQGTVNTTADTNRDINNTQEITRDQTTGMLDGSVTIDHRLLAESGRKQIIQEQKDLPENAKKSAENIRNGIDELALKLPDSQIQNKILTSINQLVGDDLIANAYKEFINNGGTKEEFFVVAKSKVAEDSIINLAQANRQIEDLVSKGYSIEEILNTSVKKAGDTSVISIEGEYQTKLTADTTIGMQLLTASYDLAKQYGDFQKHIYEEYGVDIDPNTLSVIIGTILTGPAKTLANVLTSEAYQKYGAQYVEARKDQLANYVTASAYGTSPEKISVYSDPNLKEQISKESQETIDWSKDVSESKEGAKFLTNIIESMVVGGVGKGIAKTTKIDGQDVEVSKSNFEIDISQNNKHTEIIDFEKSKQKGTPENQMVNNLKANRHYELSNGTKFKTNEYGHVEEISFKPDFDNKGVRDSRQTAVGKLGEESDVGGHIQGCAMGGTCDRYNLFPQDANFNNSAYKVYFENILKKADKEGKTIDNVTVKFTRDDLSSVRPDKLEVTFLINGKPTRETFVNTAGGGK